MKQTFSHTVAPDEHRLPEPIELMRYHDQANAARLLEILRGVIGTGPVDGSDLGNFVTEGTDGWDLYAATLFPGERRSSKHTIKKYAAQMQKGDFTLSSLTFCYLDGEIYLADGKKRLLAQGLARSAVEFSFFMHRAGSMGEVGRAHAFAHATEDGQMHLD